MTKKKKKVAPKYSSVSFKVEETLVVSQSKSVPLNLAEEKARFLRTGLTPKFEVQDQSKIAELAGKTKNRIRFDLLGEAENILENVRDQYGDGELFLEHAFGTRISKEEATPMVLEYINQNSLSESLKIHWCDGIACSAKMVWKGPVMNANKPELRKYSLWINGSDENNYMRESGIKCLMDHEIGTHFFRLINDGLQPWFSDRTRFDLRNVGSFENQCTEEGLASIHTSLRGRVRLLWSPALAYYTACKAAEMSFKELFDHLGRYTSNIDFRWKQVMRVKRGLADPRDLGGFGNDQCYFEGAVKLLRNMDNIDFHLLMAGKICMDEVDRVKRCARRDVLRYPTFMKNMAAYRRTLKKMLILNGLDQIQCPRSAPAVFTKRLLERRFDDGDTSPTKPVLKKVRSKPPSKVSHSLSKFKANSSISYHSGTGKKAGVNKDKDVRKKHFKSPEVERFPVSSYFVNTHKLKEEARQNKDRENRASKLEESVRESIKSLDCDLGTHIENLRNLAREHEWSNYDSDYRDSLVNEVSCEMQINSARQVSDRGESFISDMHASENGDCDLDLSLSVNQQHSFVDDDNTSDAALEGNSMNTKFNRSGSLEQGAFNVLQSLPEIKLHGRPKSGSFLDSADLRTAASEARNKLASKKDNTYELLALTDRSSLKSLPQDCHEGCQSARYCRQNEDLENQDIRQFQKDNQSSFDSGEHAKTFGVKERIHVEQLPGDKLIPCDAVLQPEPSNDMQGKVNLNSIHNQHSKILKRRQSTSILGIKSSNFLEDQFTITDRTHLKTPPILQNCLPLPDEIVAQFRVPKLQAKKYDRKTSLPLKGEHIGKPSVLLTTDTTFISQKGNGDRQLAKFKLGSLVRDKFDVCNNLQTKCSSNHDALSRRIITEQV